MPRTLRLIVVVLATGPLVPTIVIVAGPVTADLVAESVRVVPEVEELGVNEADTPAGNPVAEKTTLLENPPVVFTAILEVTLNP